MSLERADVAIVGGGIIGSGLASALSREGLDVVVIDPHPGLGSSLGNAGLVVPSYSTPMSTPGNLWEGVKSFGSDHAPVTFSRPLGLETLKFLASFAAASRPGRVKRDTAKLHSMATRSLQRYHELQDSGLDLGLTVQGWLWLSTSQGNRDDLRGDSERMQSAGAKCEVVSRAQADELQPGLGSEVSGGIWFPDEAFLDPEVASRRWLQDAMDHGARLIRAEVTGYRKQGERITDLTTTEGDLGAKQVVLVTGADSRAAGRLLDIRVPVEPGYGWSVTLSDPRNQLNRALMGIEDHVVISPMPGRVRITGGMRFGAASGADPADRDIAKLREHAAAVVPALADLEELTRWQGARPMTASGVPIIERRGFDNLVVAAGHGPLGVTLAPFTVDLAKELVTAGLNAARSR